MPAAQRSHTLSQRVCSEGTRARGEVLRFQRALSHVARSASGTRQCSIYCVSTLWYRQPWSRGGISDACVKSAATAFITQHIMEAAAAADLTQAPEMRTRYITPGCPTSVTCRARPKPSFPEKRWASRHLAQGKKFRMAGMAAPTKVRMEGISVTNKCSCQTPKMAQQIQKTTKIFEPIQESGPRHEMPRR